ncbi:GNAT family N-acetyltransferase [Endozoicomonas sp. YOMI1]|uniref:GNAT family N-acetyltransferase n=1 Tax=Endozoicomonas sp. YOMI1 TaxID=2828739 RepID=UPI0021474854|nr:GNAT family N-acetyltransferase [Endozoicomonas sp. YOMI1]
MKNYIFKQVRQQSINPNHHYQFIIIDGFFKALCHSLPLIQYFGFTGFIKQLIKAIMPNRIFYFLLNSGQLSACGCLNVGFCRYYQVNSSDVVIGSIWTKPELRGQGLATIGILTAMNHMISRGFYTFYIDTQENNQAMLKSIEKLGFGSACGSFNS